jgi:hypothetical protein
LDNFWEDEAGLADDSIYELYMMPMIAIAAIICYC